VAQKTIVDGRVLFDRERDIAGRPALEKEKQDLIAKEKKAAEKKPDEKKPDEKKPEAGKKPEDKAKPPSNAVERDSGEDMISSPNGGAL
jgi:peptidoglycan hydrolase CwlO-like protein